ncbi:uncharacterized protein LODBEIA_P13360 [Lodderomyces beijingensis]|uniref:HSF-type DNA-binding domain-containing protein n=1 Tax=Lodderomyces beijingensis TaxID=1775926 RepID=A0ABP0ZLN4_9ASCO
MTTDYRDPLIDLLSGAVESPSPSADDIQLINRNGSFNGAAGGHHLYQQHFPQFPNTQIPHTPVLNHQQYYSNNFDLTTPNDISSYEKIQELEKSPPQSAENRAPGQQQQQQQQQQQHQLEKEQDFDLQLFNRNNTQVPPMEKTLPPMPPLSESVLPNTLKPLEFNQEINPSKPPHIQIQGNPAKRRKESTGPKARPAFVMKIWSMVNDDANSEYIRWNDDGKTFQVFHREDFMKIILPKYFKHNNFASFVRQLNMYGWHKVQDINNGTMNQSFDKNGSDEIWQFENPNFVRDREDLLDKIVRNKSTSGQDELLDAPHGNSTSSNMSLILSELETIKMNQYAISEDLRRVRHDNKMLWQENYLNRERQQVQGRTLDKVLKFLAASYGNKNNNKLMDANNFPHQGGRNSPMLHRAQSQPPEEHDQHRSKQKSAHAKDDEHISPTYQSPTSSETSSARPQMRYKPRLLIANRAYSRRPSMSRAQSSPASIEEIIRSHNMPDPAEASVKNMYQHWVNQESASSPRLLFPELNAPVYDNIESELKSSGQSIEQVQDWIEKLSQQQEATLAANNGDTNNRESLDHFNIDDYIQNGSPAAYHQHFSPTPHHPQPNGGIYSSQASSGRKRTIQEIYDGNDE